MVFSQMIHTARVSCPGTLDSHGKWSTGFECPKWRENDKDNCCGDEHKRFCCPPPDKHHSHRRKKLKNDPKNEMKHETSDKYNWRSDEERGQQNEKPSLLPRYPMYQKPIFEAIETSTQALQTTHSNQESALPLNLLLSIIMRFLLFVYSYFP